MENKLSELEKAEHFTALLVAGGILVYLIKTYSHFSVDFAAFVIFMIMCYAGYSALKAAQDIAISIENTKQLKYNKLKTSMHIVTGSFNAIKPCAFKDSSKFSKYATSTYSRNLKLSNLQFV